MSCRLFTRTRGFAMEWTRLALTPSPLGPSGWTRAKHLTRSSSRLPCAAALEYLVVFCPVLFAITIGHIPPYFATYALLRIPRTFCLRFTFVFPYKYACILQTTIRPNHDGGDGRWRTRDRRCFRASKHDLALIRAQLGYKTESTRVNTKARRA